MCGIVGIVAKSEVNQDIFDSLTALQHRGQDAAGIATSNEDGRIYIRKGKGLVRDVIRTRHMYHLQGHIGIGQVRYPTAGSDREEEAQPFYVNSPYGIMLAHNGNLTNSSDLKHELIYHDLRHLNTGSDSEVLLNVFAHELQNIHKVNVDEKDIFQAVSAVHTRCKGAYGVVAMISGVGLVAFRDPHGIRPLIYGQRTVKDQVEYMVSSESVALDMLGFNNIVDVAPGEAIFITQQGQIYKQQCAEKVKHTPCLFEYVYLARPDSIIDKVLVYKVRLRLGEMLARKIEKEWPNHDINVVIPIPDTSRTAAAVLARRLELKFREGFVKNRYIARTFIMSEQNMRRKSVRRKLNPIPLEFKGKNVLLVDDSIVRGTTAKEIIQIARDAGANKVYFGSASPEVRYPNVYGIDMPSASELMANGRSTEEICELIGADGLIYQDLQVLYDAAREGNSKLKCFEDSIFTGNYITGDIDSNYLKELESKRNNKARMATASDEYVI